MRHKKYRVLPIGFFLFVISVVVVLICISTTARSISAPNKLLYLINKQMDINQYGISNTIKLKTTGDIIENKTNDFVITSDMIIDKKNGILKSTSQLEMNGNALPSLDALITDKHLLLKSTESDIWSYLEYENLHLLLEDDFNVDLEFEKLVKILDLSNPKLKDLISSNLINIKKHFNDYVRFDETNKNNITISFTLEALFDKLICLTDDFLLHKDFKEIITKRSSELYELYGSNSIINHLNLNSAFKHYSSVECTDDFETKIYSRLDSLKESVYYTFKESSDIEIAFIIENSKIIAIDINATLFYKSSDASENIHLLFEYVDFENIPVPDKDNRVSFTENHAFNDFLLDIIK